MSGVVVSLVFSCGSRSLFRVAIGSQFVSEASLGGGKSGILVTVVMPFEKAWFQCQCQPPRSVCSSISIS